MFQADVLVVGGGFAGVAAACAAATAGRKVLLIERRTYLGAEMTATLRYWLTPEQHQALNAVFGWSGEFVVPTETGLAVVPDQIKVALEDRLLAAGVQLLFGARLIGVNGRRAEIAGKFGLRTVEADIVLDTLEAPGEAGAERVLEWTGVDYALLNGLPARQGHLTEAGHLLVPHPVTTADEVAARFESMAYARQLKAHPAFAEARLTGSSHEVAAPPRDPAEAARHGWELGTRLADSPGKPRPVTTRTVDVLVVGGGTSGASAAIGAARRGARTLVADMNPGLGGAGTVGGVDSYWFGRRGGFNAEVSQWVAEEHGWLGHKAGKWNIEAKMHALLKAACEAGVEVLLNTVLVDVRRSPAGRVTGALLATPHGLEEVTAVVTIDATGDGDVAYHAGAPYVYGSDREGMTMWYSMAPLLKPGVVKNNFTSTVDVGDPADYTRAILSARRRLPGHDHGPYVAPRESRHILGSVRVTLTDILTMRRWPDLVNIHYSNHDVKGQNTSDWLRMGLIPPNLEVELPYRALVPNGLEGLLIAGKAFSATHDSLPPIRMQADLENLGFVCGTAAAMCVQQGVTPRELPVSELQAELVKAGILPESVLTRAAAEPRPPAEAEMRGWIEALRDDEQLFLYGETEMHEVRREPIPMVQVCAAGHAIVPLLRAALGEEPRRLHVALALAWYGDQAATPVLLEEITRHLSGDHLPLRTAHIRYTQASPDHGAMPELAYLLHSLAMVRDPRAIPVLSQVAERLDPTEERFREMVSGVFHYVDAVCDIAERLGHPDAVPALRKLHSYPLLNGNVSQAAMQPDFFAERKAYLESVIGRAMARCGEPEGAGILVRYLRDSRRMLVRHAHRELRAISGHDWHESDPAWQEWAAGLVTLDPNPWVEPGRQITKP